MAIAHIFVHFYADVNECLGKKGKCCTHAHCENYPGSFECVCDMGYREQKKGRKTSCVGKNKNLFALSYFNYSLGVNIVNYSQLKTRINYSWVVALIYTDTT